MNEREVGIPIPEDPVLLSDLDNTLVEDGFKFLPEHIVPTITKAKAEGLKIGLSSDTPFEALEIWRDRFGMNGPLIAEKGAIVGTESGLIYNKSDNDAFLSSRESITEESSKRGFLVWKGNPVEALRTDLHIGNPEDKVLLVNNFRRCSLGFFFRKVGRSGSLEVNGTTTFLTMQIIREHYPIFDVDEDFNEKYGLVIVARKGTNKRSGTKILMGSEKLNEIGMIGDSMSDYLGSDMAKHYAVANASEAFKKESDYIANKRLAQGVTEILEKIIKNRK